MLLRQWEIYSHWRIFTFTRFILSKSLAFTPNI